MHLVLLCATQRGYRVLEHIARLRPDLRLTVFSFRETPHEPPYLDRIATLTHTLGGRFIEAQQVGSKAHHLFWEENPVDLMLVVSWRYLIPAAVYERPRLGTFVFHDSLLPAYRGFSPTVWAVLNGESQTGASLFHIAEAVDAGDIVGQQAVPIGPDDTIGQVMEGVTEAYLHLLSQHLDGLLTGTAPRIPQDHSAATFTCRLLPDDNRINWSEPTTTIYNRIRGYTDPYPGAFTELEGRILRVWKAERLPDYPLYVGRVPGRVVEVQPGRGAVVLTGDGALCLTEVQWGDEDRRPAADILTKTSMTLGR